MNYPSPKERIEFWRFYRALGCFVDAEAQLKYIIKNKESIPNNLYPCALTGFYVMYGRPFKKSSGVEPLSTDIIPKSMMDIHKEIITFRDKLFAHGDLKGRIEDFDDYLDFAVLTVEKGKAHWETDWRFPAKIRLKEYLPICSLLIEKMVYHRDKITKRWNSKRFFPSHDGRYFLNIRDKEQELFYVYESP